MKQSFFMITAIAMALASGGAGIVLRKGWNHVQLIVPKTDKSGRWTATFIPLLGTSAHPREVPDLAYSATPPKE